MTKLRKFRKLSRFERKLLLQAFFLLPATALAFRLFGLKHLRATLPPIPNSETKQAETLAQAQNAQCIARMVRIAATHGFRRASCLVQSLVLWRLLRRHGIASELRIGTRKAENQFQAHAWVECGGVPLNDSGDVRDSFTAFDLDTVST